LISDQKKLSYQFVKKCLEIILTKFEKTNWTSSETLLAFLTILNVFVFNYLSTNLYVLL